MRYAARTDENQKEIVDHLRHCGVEVYVAKLPCDLICVFRDKTTLIDVQGVTKNRKRDKKQLDIFHRLGVKLVKTIEDAKYAVGVFQT